MTSKIGIASNHLIHPTERFGTNFVDYIQRDYVTGLRQADVLPFVLPLGDPKDAKAYIESVDGLLLSGGQGVTPILYGEEPLAEVAETDIYRDQFEIALVKAAQEAGKPVWGFAVGCRSLTLPSAATSTKIFISRRGPLKAQPVSNVMGNSDPSRDHDFGLLVKSNLR